MLRFSRRVYTGDCAGAEQGAGAKVQTRFI